MKFIETFLTSNRTETTNKTQQHKSKCELCYLGYKSEYLFGINPMLLRKPVYNYLCLCRSVVKGARLSMTPNHSFLVPMSEAF